MSIGRQMDKEVINIHNGLLLSYEQECIWVSSNEVDEPRAYYREWSKSRRERQKPYINEYINMYIYIYLYIYICVCVCVCVYGI